MKKSTMVIIGIFLLVFLALGFSGSKPVDTSSNVSTETVASTSTPVAETPSESAPADVATCDMDWKYSVTNNIGQYYTAPTGSSYVIVDLYLKNNDDRSISTNPYSWDFAADGITYNVDVATFSEGIKQQSVDVGKGGEMESQFVYLVKGTPAAADFKYNGFSGPTLQRVEHYSK